MRKYIKNNGNGDNLGKIYLKYWDWRQCWENISRVLGLETILGKVIETIGIGDNIGKIYRENWDCRNFG